MLPAEPTTVRGITKLVDVIPLFRFPTVQVIAWPTAVQPPGNVPTVKSAGTESVRVTPVAFCGPRLVAERVR